MSWTQHKKNISNNPYKANGMNTHIITPKGRGNFVGVIDLETGKIRIDDYDNPSFWMEIDLSKCEFSQYAPGGKVEKKIKKSFEMKVETCTGTSKGSLSDSESE